MSEFWKLNLAWGGVIVLCFLAYFCFGWQPLLWVAVIISIPLIILDGFVVITCAQIFFVKMTEAYHLIFKFLSKL